MIHPKIIQATEVIILALIIMIFTPIVIKVIATIFGILVIIAAINKTS